MSMTDNRGADVSQAAPRRRAELPRNVAFWLVALQSVLLLISSTVPSPMYVIYQQRWHFSATMITVVFGVYAVFVLVSMLLFGSLSDTAGRRRVLRLALAVVVVAMALFWAANGVAMLLVARALQGVGVGIATGTIAAALIELSPRSTPMRGMKINTVAPTFGMAVGALFSGVLVQYGPWKTELSYVILLVCFALLGVLSFVMPETAPNADGGMRLVPRRISVPRQARRPFFLVSLSIIAVWAIGGLYLSLGPSIVAQMLHNNSYVLGGLVVTALAGGGTVAQLIFGRLSGLRPIVLGAVLLLIGLGADTLALSRGSGWLFFVGTVVLGLGWGCAFMGAFRSMAGLADPQHRGELLAGVYVVAYLAMSIPAIIAGIAVPHAGLHTTTNVFTAVVAALVVLAVLGLPFVARHHKSGRAGAHWPLHLHHAPAPCCMTDHETTGHQPAVPVPVPAGAGSAS